VRCRDDGCEQRIPLFVRDDIFGDAVNAGGGDWRGRLGDGVEAD